MASIVREGGNVYAETIRYNYSPVWFHVLHALDSLPLLAADRFDGLRWKVVMLLTITDVGIFVFLLRQYSLRVASLFFLNPISIIITGYHNQFDNLAVLTALWSVLWFEQGKSRIHRVAGILGIALSLCIKHILFLFPLWLAVKQKSWSRRIAVVAIPYGIFLLSFVPYWSTGAQGIRNNVFLYRSMQNAPLWSVLIPVRHLPVSKTSLFFGTLFVLGVCWRKKPALESIHYYLVSLVTFSSAVTNQYLAICTPSIAVMWNWAFALYTFFGTVTLFVDPDGLHFQPFWDYIPFRRHDLAILFLATGLLIAVVGRKRTETVTPD